MTQASDMIATLIAARGHRRCVVAGAVLFHEADVSTRVYACLSGRFRLAVSAAPGRELVLDVCGPGDVFGNLSALDHVGRSATATATEPSVVAELDGETYAAAVTSDPSLAQAALESLARQLRRANARICAGETEPVATRTARMLLELAEQHAGEDPAQYDWVVTITQRDLAEWLGATREATARSLSVLRRDGVITTGRSRMIVHDRAALAARARVGQGRGSSPASAAPASRGGLRPAHPQRPAQ